MLKKDITYNDLWTGQKKTEPFFFHFTEMELVRLQAEHDGKLKDEIEFISSGQATNKVILRFFEEFVSKSYGERVGDRFIKNQDVVDSFLASPPYSALMISFFEESSDAAAFLNGLMPPELVARAEERRAEQASSEEIPSDDKDIVVESFDSQAVPEPQERPILRRRDLRDEQ